MTLADLPVVARAFVELVARMREAQRVYYKVRTPEALGEAKSLERQVDMALAAWAET